MELDTLVSHFKNGDSKAFERLYQMYFESIHGVIYNIVRDEGRTQELTQDVFVKIWNSRTSYSSEKGRFFTWILNVARNTAIDELRSKGFKNKKQNLNTDFFVDIIGGHDRLDKKTDAIGIAKFIEKLASKCKSLIELLYFKGYTQKEAAEEMNKPENQ